MLWIKGVLLKVCCHPMFAVVLTILGVVAGLFGSVYSSELKTSFPLNLFKSVDSTIPEAALFWLALIVVAFLFFGRQWATDQMTKSAQNNLIAQSDTLQELIKTLPPQGFLNRFSERFSLCYGLTHSIVADESSVTIEEIEKVIRVILSSIVHLAREFDGQPNGVRYAANIMIYTDLRNVESKTLESYSANLLFFDRAPSTLQGVLAMEPTLSAAGDLTQGAADPFIEKFFLPVDSKEVSPQGKLRQLPGAPLAFWQKEGALHYEDATTLGDWCRKNGDFPESVSTAIDSYFRSEKAQRIKSFVSMPIPSALNSDQPLGVLNIHRSSVNMLRGQEAFRLFFPLLNPYTFLIGELLQVRSRKV